MVQKVIQISFISLVCLSSLVSSVMFDSDTTILIFIGIIALLGITLSVLVTVQVKLNQLCFNINLNKDCFAYY